MYLCFLIIALTHLLNCHKKSKKNQDDTKPAVEVDQIGDQKDD